MYVLIIKVFIFKIFLIFADENDEAWKGITIRPNCYSWGETQKRSKKLVFDGYWYIGHSRFELTSKGEFKRWRCCHYPKLGCKAKVTLNDDDSITLGGAHNHKRMKDLYLQKNKMKSVTPIKTKPVINLAQLIPGYHDYTGPNDSIKRKQSSLLVSPRKN